MHRIIYVGIIGIHTIRVLLEYLINIYHACYLHYFETQFSKLLLLFLHDYWLLVITRYYLIV